MKTVRKFGILAFALAALAAVFPQSALASGSIRSIFPVNPQTGKEIAVPGPDKPYRIGDTLAFKVRLLNYCTNATDSVTVTTKRRFGGLDNYWEFKPRSSWVPEMADALPALGLMLGKGEEGYRLAKLDLSLSGLVTGTGDSSIDGYYTDFVFKYTIQSGDMAGPVKFSNNAKNGPIDDDTVQVMPLENVGPGKYWTLEDRHGHVCEFEYGFSELEYLLPGSTGSVEPLDPCQVPPIGWSSASEVSDTTLAKAGF